MEDLLILKTNTNKMSILAFYTYEGKGKILPTNNTVVKTLVNQGAICTVDRVMVIITSDTSFTLEEVKEVIEFVEQEKKELWKSTNK